MKELGIYLSKKANGALGSNPCVTYSKQSTYGLNERNAKPVHDKGAMLQTHGNMIVSVASILLGIYVFKKNPELGTVLCIGGAGLSMVVASDWKAGKKYISNVSC
jgi:hypothetical protein